MERTELLKIHLKEFWFAPCDAFLRAVEAVLWQQQQLKPKILDIGIGDARYDSLLFSGLKIDVGIDPDGPAIERAKRCQLFKKVYQANAQDLPFKGSLFSTVISNSVFEHIQKDLQAVQEVARVLKKDGHFLLTVPSPQLLKTLRKCGANKRWIEWYNKRVVQKHFRTREQWENILSKNSFEVENCRFYFSDEAVRIWYRLFRLTTFKPYHRELWSYLKDSPYGKLFPKRLIAWLLFLSLRGIFRRSFVGQGNWMFITAKKV